MADEIDVIIIRIGNMKWGMKNMIEMLHQEMVMHQKILVSQQQVMNIFVINMMQKS